MKHLLIILAASALLASCGKDEKSKLVGKWYGASQEIPSLDSMLNIQKVFLDTVGNSTTPEQEMELYGTDNLDSLINEERAALDILAEEQKRYMKDTRLEFRADGVVLYNLSNRIDSANWYFNEDKELVFDEMKLKGAGEKTVMILEKLTNTELTLRFSENDFSGTITFNREK